MKKQEVKKKMDDELEFLFKQIISETMDKRSFRFRNDPGYSRVCEYNAIVRLEFMFDFIDGDKMDKMTSHALDTYQELKEKVLKE